MSRDILLHCTIAPEAAMQLYVPALGRLYSRLDTLAETLLRVIAGGLLIVHGWPKITNPFGAAGMVERIGFFPGTFWSPLLAATEFFGGILLALGLLTRPVALANTISMLVVIYFHAVVLGQEFGRYEYPIMWAAVLFLFLVRGANAWSVDARIGRQF
jgi:putative oxidoreductase